MSEIKVRTLSSSYVYNSYNYESKIVDYVMKADRIHKTDEGFGDITYDVKRRQVSNSLVKVLESPKTILMKPAMPMPKAFKVMCAKDIKDGGDLKIFIDADIINISNGNYKCYNPDILVAYLVNAMNTMLYHVDPKRIVMREEIIKSGARCFSSLFTYIIDYLCKISITPGTRNKCIYLSSMYYLNAILGKDITTSMKTLCKQISKITDHEEQMLNIFINDKSFIDIKMFIETTIAALKLNGLTMDVFIEKWVYLFGTGTQFAFEHYPSFAAMLTDAYVGCYLNNQKTIEKVVGRDMVDFSKAILSIGGEALG